MVIAHQNNRGPSVARKKGIELSTGQYLAFCDSDDWVEPNWLESMYQVLKNNNADIGVCRAVIEGVNTLYNPKQIWIWNKEEAIETFLQHKQLNGSLVVKLFKRELLLNVKFSETLKHYEDDYVLWQVLQLVRVVARVNMGLYHITVHSGSLSNSAYSIKQWEDTSKVWNYIFKDCNQEYNKQYLFNACLLRAKIFLEQFKLMLKYNFYNKEAISMICHSLRKIGLSGVLKLERRSNKLLAMTIMVSPKLPKVLFYIFPKRNY